MGVHTKTTQRIDVCYCSVPTGNTRESQMPVTNFSKYSSSLEVVK